MKEEAKKTSSQDYQRLMWEALKKTINGLINKINTSNIKHIIPEIFQENIIRAKGLLCRSVMKAQAASPTFTPVFAALIAVINTKIPEIGELLLKRLIITWRKAYNRNDKRLCITLSKFLAHLTNQRVVDESLAMELLTLLLDKPTEDGIEIAVGFVKEVGHVLSQLGNALNIIFDRFKAILHEGMLDQRTEYLIEDIFAVRKSDFDGLESVPKDLDLVEEDDQITHEVSLLDNTLDAEQRLDFFHADPNYEENEEKYQAVKREILGDDSSADEADSEEESEDDEEAEAEQEVNDMSEQRTVQLRRNIYLTIMSSLDFEECCHKILRGPVSPKGREQDVVSMIVECCAQERTYLRFYGLLGQRFCMMKRVYQEAAEEEFKKQYSIIHRHETNKLRNIAKFFSHLLHTDALPWIVLQNISLSEGETTSSSRIFIKILFQELAEYMGLTKLNDRLRDPTLVEHFGGLFPKDSPKNARFAINFFTSIGLGGLTDDLRAWLKDMPAHIRAQQQALAAARAAAQADSSDSESSSSLSSSSSSSSDSD
eukprot:TRINITY_DN54412_c0_g1_i1.p1 TRINITY_DN54412_c0_g1~~TRINITY_DN54412_c0_g1_i1.p1  ORF type:complete len:587 (+),score=75.74 TRINITY_DN54412_c0_g1_i1:136-1761(+)